VIQHIEKLRAHFHIPGFALRKPFGNGQVDVALGGRELRSPDITNAVSSFRRNRRRIMRARDGSVGLNYRKSKCKRIEVVSTRDVGGCIPVRCAWSSIRPRSG